MTASSKTNMKAGGWAVGNLSFGIFFVVGCVLIFAGLVIRGLDVGTCPVMGFNNVVSPCIHTFPGTDVPITPAGDMVMIVGGVLVVTMLILFLRTRIPTAKSST